MESIKYRDTRVDNDTVERLRKQMKETPEHGVVLFNGYRKYANLQGWRNQQLHKYLRDTVEEYEKYSLCSCGLEVLETEINSGVIAENHLPEEIRRLNMPELMRVRFHVDFEDDPKPASALIVSATFDWTLRTYLWAAYCQACFEMVVHVLHDDALLFTNSYNSRHLSSC